MNKFIKTFETYKQSYINESSNEIPQEVISSAKDIVEDNFEKAFRLSIEGDIIRFKVSKMDFKMADPNQPLNMELSPGAYKKRKFSVKLSLIDTLPATEKDKDNIGGELIYRIEFKPKGSDDPIIHDEEEKEFVDEWENREKEEEFPEEPDIPEELVGKKKRKSKHVQGIEDWFINHDNIEDED
jgi:hypothetical protein